MASASEAFARLGVNVTGEGNLRSMDDILADVADGLASTENATTRLATAQEIFGRGGLVANPLSQRGVGRIARNILGVRGPVVAQAINTPLPPT